MCVFLSASRLHTALSLARSLLGVCSVLASTSSSCAPAKHLRTAAAAAVAAACPHTIQIQIGDTHAHTHSYIQPFTQKSNYRRSLDTLWLSFAAQALTIAGCLFPLSLSISSSPYWLFGCRRRRNRVASTSCGRCLLLLSSVADVVCVKKKLLPTRRRPKKKQKKTKGPQRVLQKRSEF